MRRLTSILALFVGGWLPQPSRASRSGRVRRSVPPRQRHPRRRRSSISTASPAITRDSAPPDSHSIRSTPRTRAPIAEVWERVIAKLRAGSMPPPGRPRPDAATYRAVASALETRNRSRVGGAPQSRTHRRRASAESRGVQQRDSRPVRARPRRASRCCPATRRPTAASTTSPTCSRFRLRTWSATCRSRGRSRGSRRACLRRARGSRRFEIPLHVLQDDRQSEDLPLGSRGGIAIRYNFPVDGEYLDQGSSAAAVSGLPQGHGMAAAARRAPRRQAAEAVHRRRRGAGPAAAASYAGDGEPGFAGDPEWEKYMQLERRCGPGGPRHR